MTISTTRKSETVLTAEDIASGVGIEERDDSTAGPAVCRDEFQEFPSIPSLRHHPLQTVAWMSKAGIGVISLAALLAIASTIPVVNAVALGYLMEAQGRVARTGKFRSAFYLLPAASRLAGIVLGVALWLLPVRFLAAATRDSWLLAPGGTVTWLWTVALTLVSMFVATHLLLAIGCGGGWWRFVRPLNNIRRLRTRWQSGNYWRSSHHAIYEFVAAWRLPHLLWLGLMGYAAAYLWIAVPTFLFTILDDVTNRMQIVGFIAGSITLTIVLLWLPFMLAHVAATGSWQAMFELRPVLRLASRVPLRWALATALLLGCSVLPMLYEALFKIRIPPHDARWDLMIVFLVTVMPARVLVGWAYHAAAKRESREPSWLWRGWQVANGLALCFGVGWYVYFLNLASIGGELGSGAIWQFHAMLLPLPF